MKILFILLSLLWLNGSEEYIILDRDLKKPCSRSVYFTPEDYFNKNFPIYAGDQEAVIEALKTTAKRISQGYQCTSFDTIKANRSYVTIIPFCDGMRELSVILKTPIRNSHTVYSFIIVSGENNSRKAQKRLLDVATYLSE